MTLQIASPSDIHARVFAFITGEFARKNEHQCKSIALLRGRGTVFNDEIRTWHRAENPERFELQRKDLSDGKTIDNPSVRDFATEIISIAEGEALNSPGIKHRFTVRSDEVYSGRNTCGFTIVTAQEGDTDEELQPTAAGQTQLMMRAFSETLRANKDMHQSTLGVVGGIAQQQARTIEELRKTNEEQRKRIIDLESDKTREEYEIYKDQLADNRAKQGMDRLFQIGSVALATMTQGKLGAIGNGANGADGSSPLVMMLREFFGSITPQQGQTLLSTFEMPQLLMLKTIQDLVTPQEGPPPPANGANTTSPNGAANGAH